MLIQRCDIAGLVLELHGTADAIGRLRGAYADYPAGSDTADVTVALNEVRELPARSVGVEYPAFEHQRVAEGLIRVSRADASGEIAVPADPAAPVTARFDVTEATAAGDAAIRIAASLALVRRDGFLLHASCLGWGDRCHIFSGPSGAGKSTIAQLLNSTSPTVIADELVVVRRQHGVWRGFASPFRTSGAIDHGSSARIEALHFLSHGPKHVRMALTPAASLRQLLKNIVVYASEERSAAAVLQVASELVTDVACFDLTFAKRADVVEVLEIA